MIIIIILNDLLVTLSKIILNNYKTPTALESRQLFTVFPNNFYHMSQHYLHRDRTLYRDKTTKENRWDYSVPDFIYVYIYIYSEDAYRHFAIQIMYEMTILTTDKPIH